MFLGLSYVLSLVRGIITINLADLTSPLYTAVNQHYLHQNTNYRRRRKILYTNYKTGLFKNGLFVLLGYTY